MRSPKRSAPFSMGRPQPRHLARLLGAGSKRWGTTKDSCRGTAELFERQFLGQLEVAAARADQTSTDAWRIRCFRHQLLVGSRELIRLQYVTAEFGVTNSGWVQIGNKCFCQIEIRTSHQQ